MNIKKFLIGGAASALMLGSVVTAAFAAPGADPNPTKGNDNPGFGPYTAPGYDSAIGNTICANHGAFGYYAHGAMTEYDTPRAADGAQTAINNSNLCGNPQGVPSQ